MTKAKIRTVQLPSGKTVPALGQGTWEMAQDISKRSQEIAALRKGLDLGMTLIDTAELYTDGKAEELVAEAIGSRRKEAYIVSKVLPDHATRKGTIEACERSLQRLQTDYLDLYLLHWIGSIPFNETLEAFKTLKQQGKILDYGVSNFDVSEMENALSVGGNQIAVNQVLYNLTSRGIELDLIPWCDQHRIPVMAYSPFGHDKLFLNDPAIKKVASRHNATTAQIALAWVLRQKQVIAIPKASNPNHVIENAGALDLNLTPEDLSNLDQAFPPPTKKSPLAIL